MLNIVPINGAESRALRISTTEIAVNKKPIRRKDWKLKSGRNLNTDQKNRMLEKKRFNNYLIIVT